MYAQDLQSRSLPLMLQTPNGRHAVGLNRDKWVLNPSSTSSTHLEMFAFLGKLMGIAIRSKEYLALSIPSLIWKLLVSDSPTLEDLEGVDLSLVKSMNSIRHIDQEGIDADTFSMTFFETFTTTTTDDRIVELVLDGATKDVTFENRTEYCDLVLKVYNSVTFVCLTSTLSDRFCCVTLYVLVPTPRVQCPSCCHSPRSGYNGSCLAIGKRHLLYPFFLPPLTIS